MRAACLVLPQLVSSAAETRVNNRVRRTAAQLIRRDTTWFFQSEEQERAVAHIAFPAICSTERLMILVIPVGLISSGEQRLTWAGSRGFCTVFPQACRDESLLRRRFLVEAGEKSHPPLTSGCFSPKGFGMVWLATRKSPFSTWYFAMSDFLFKRNPLFDSASLGMA